MKPGKDTLGAYYKAKETYLKGYILYDLKSMTFQKRQNLARERLRGWGRGDQGSTELSEQVALQCWTWPGALVKPLE